MTVSVANQATVFLMCLLCGVVIGIVFDLSRCIRRLTNCGDVLTFVCDLLFMVMAFVIFFLCAVRFNYGDVRIFMIVSAMLGLIFYFFTLSKLFIFAVTYTVKFVVQIILLPVKLLIKIFRRPIIFAANIGIKGAKKIKNRLKNMLYPFKKYIYVLKKRKNMV